MKPSEFLETVSKKASASQEDSNASFPGTSTPVSASSASAEIPSNTLSLSRRVSRSSSGNGSGAISNKAGVVANRHHARKGGRHKPLQRTGWCHVTCALFVPELYFRDRKPFDEVCGLAKLKAERLRLTCCVCGVSNRRKRNASITPLVVSGASPDTAAAAPGERDPDSSSEEDNPPEAKHHDASDGVEPPTSTSVATETGSGGLSACLQCSRPRCSRAFHAECARRVGYCT